MVSEVVHMPDFQKAANIDSMEIFLGSTADFIL